MGVHVVCDKRRVLLRARRQDLKELKLRPNTDVHDYRVRLRAAQKFIAKARARPTPCWAWGLEPHWAACACVVHRQRARARMPCSARNKLPLQVDCMSLRDSSPRRARAHPLPGMGD